MSPRERNIKRSPRRQVITRSPRCRPGVTNCASRRQASRSSSCRKSRFNSCRPPALTRRWKSARPATRHGNGPNSVAPNRERRTEHQYQRPALQPMPLNFGQTFGGSIRNWLSFIQLAPGFRGPPKRRTSMARRAVHSKSISRDRMSPRPTTRSGPARWPPPRSRRSASSPSRPTTSQPSSARCSAGYSTSRPNRARMSSTAAFTSS